MAVTRIPKSPAQDAEGLSDDRELAPPLNGQARPASPSGELKGLRGALKRPDQPVVTVRQMRDAVDAGRRR